MVNDVNLHPYAAAIIYHLKNKDVEIYQGDSRQTDTFKDFELSQKSIIRGKIVDAMGDCIIVECKTNNGTNLAYLNCWSIHNIVPINGRVAIKDIYYNEEQRTNKR